MVNKMERVILEKLDIDTVSYEQFHKKMESWRKDLPEEDDIFLDGDASAICCDRMIGGE